MSRPRDLVLDLAVTIASELQSWIEEVTELHDDFLEARVEWTPARVVLSIGDLVLWSSVDHAETELTYGRCRLKFVAWIGELAAFSSKGRAKEKTLFDV